VDAFFEFREAEPEALLRLTDLERLDLTLEVRLWDLGRFATGLVMVLAWFSIVIEMLSGPVNPFLSILPVEACCVFKSNGRNNSWAAVPLFYY